ncbi:MAG TPA: type II toxin-antitoxin system HicB family antitoxin [Candidatus Manganitrophaceae bacterium]|nr:type II toxin-antitoxin system HicB family antitoxin [Candidatus Manganitrophaceae bacterium]
MSYYVYITQKDNYFIAEVPALPGCRTIGRSEAEVIENIRDVVRGYFQSLRKSNRAVPKVKVVKVSERSSSFRAVSSAVRLLDPEEGPSHVGPSSL